MPERIMFGIRVRKPGGEWRRVKTKTHTQGRWRRRSEAVKVLKDLQTRGYVGTILRLRIRTVPGQPAVKVWLKGDVFPIADVPRKHRANYRDTLYRAARAAKRYGRPIHVNSSYRPIAEQWRLYNQNMISPGVPRPGRALTAYPGTSKHGLGLALDIQDARTIPKLIKQLRREKLIDDVASEIWHVTNRAR